jgi:hypothetical protein
MSVWIGSGLVSVLIQRLDPDVLPAVRVAAMAAGLYESGRRLGSPFMRGAGHLLLYVGLIIHLADLGTTLELGRVPARLWSAAGLAGFAWLLRWRTRQGEAAELESNSAIGLGWVPFVLIVAGVPAEVDGWRIPSLWAGIALAYASYGRQMDAAGQRVRGAALVTLAFAAAMMLAASLDDPARVVLGHGGLVVGALVVMALMAPPREEGEEGLEAWARPGLALMATVLGGSLLASALETRWLTLAWGVHGALSLGLGFAARERVIRLAGLGWLSLCTLKLFLYDLSGLDTPFRILSFVALGLLMIAASWVYARLEKVASAE